MTEPASRGHLTNRVIGDPEMRRLLVVEDEESIRLALAKFLRSRGFEVESAASGSAALAQLQQHRFALMLCDIRLPGITGLELVPKAHALDPDLAVVMLTAVNDALTAAESISLGAMDYLTKPVDLLDLLAAVQRVLHRRDFAIEKRNVERLIHDEVERRTAAVEREREVVIDSTVQALASLVVMHEANDPFMSGTSLRVTALAEAIAEEMTLPSEVVRNVRIAARLHDIGMVALRSAVLHKPGALSPEELEHVQEHVRVGVEILAPLPHLQDVVAYVRDHHEYWDGTGYPKGIAGEAISLGGRILCAADAFIALTSRRSYRPPMSAEDTVDSLAAHVGGILDPAVYEALRTVVAQRRVLGLTAD